MTITRPTGAVLAHPHDDYVLVTYSDFDAGSFVAREVIRNLNVLIPQKTGKIADVRPRYHKWRLVFVDYIGATPAAHERVLIPQHVAPAASTGSSF